MTDNEHRDDDKLTRFITESAQQIWSAGLGALSMAEKEGSKLFETLARLGDNLESGTRKTASAATNTVSGARNSANDTWDRLEEMFQLRVARALNALQIPTAKDINELSERVDQLALAVDELSRRKRKSPAKTARKKKPAAKKRKKKSGSADAS